MMRNTDVQIDTSDFMTFASTTKTSNNQVDPSNSSNTDPFLRSPSGSSDLLSTTLFVILFLLITLSLN